MIRMVAKGLDTSTVAGSSRGHVPIRREEVGRGHCWRWDWRLPCCPRSARPRPYAILPDAFKMAFDTWIVVHENRLDIRRVSLIMDVLIKGVGLVWTIREANCSNSDVFYNNGGLLDTLGSLCVTDMGLQRT